MDDMLDCLAGINAICTVLDTFKPRWWINKATHAVNVIQDMLDDLRSVTSE